MRNQLQSLGRTSIRQGSINALTDILFEDHGAFAPSYVREAGPRIIDWDANWFLRGWRLAAEGGMRWIHGPEAGALVVPPFPPVEPFKTRIVAWTEPAGDAVHSASERKSTAAVP